MMIQAAIEGHGITLGWKQTTEDLLRSAVLVRPFKESLHLPEGFATYQYSPKTDRPEVQVLLDWLKSELTQPIG